MSDILNKNFIDNKEILNILFENFFNSNLSHATIIHGDKGIGKASFVKYFTNNVFSKISNLNIQNSLNQKSLIQNNSHPNLMVMSKLLDEKTKKIKQNISVDQIRNLESFIYQSSINNLPKFILFDTADDLNISSSNALLKILEEPKKNTYFFLISNQVSKLLPTIRSRCIKFKFNKPSYTEFKKIILSKKEDISDEDEIKYLYNLSNSSPGIALHFLSGNIIDSFKKFISLLNERKPISDNIIKFCSEINRTDNDKFLNFLFIVKYTLINILKINLGINIKKNLPSNIFNSFQNLSKHIKTYSCLKTLEYLNKNEQNLLIYNLDKKIFTFNLFSEISSK